MTDSRPTIAHVLHRMHVAGAEVLAADLARRLADRFRFIFFCLDGVGTLGEELQREGIEVVELHRKPGVDWSVASKIKQLARDHRVDLLHAHQYTPFFYAAASRRIGTRPKILFTEHGRHYPDARSRKRVFVNQFLLRGGDRVTAVGEFIKQALVKNEGIAAGRIEVVRNGIDPDKFRAEKSAVFRAEVRTELGLAPDQRVVLQVARFHPVKDHRTAIEAMAAVVKKIPGSLLLLAGDGDLKSEIETLAEQRGCAANVRFLGVRNDVPRLMAAADVFLLSSLSEGISVTLLEAMGCELPIAATDVGGNGEVVEHGVTGLLSPRSDHAKLAENLRTLLGDPALRRRMGLAGRARLLERFTQEQMHKRYAEIYGEMV